jgi:hypothetical protein
LKINNSVKIKKNGKTYYINLINKMKFLSKAAIVGLLLAHGGAHKLE